MQESLHDVRVAVLSRQSERCPTFGPDLVHVRPSLQKLCDLMRALLLRGEHERAPALVLRILPPLPPLLQPPLGLDQRLAHLLARRVELARSREVFVRLLRLAEVSDGDASRGSPVQRLAAVGVEHQHFVGMGYSTPPITLLQADLRHVQMQSDAKLGGFLRQLLADSGLQFPAIALGQHPCIQKSDLALGILQVQPAFGHRLLLAPDVGAGLQALHHRGREAGLGVHKRRPVLGHHPLDAVVRKHDLLDQPQPLDILRGGRLDIALDPSRISKLLVHFSEGQAILNRGQLQGESHRCAGRACTLAQG
mmetsp:Transcript_53224/g.150761  ORF Transcript_53224/g.150761 Transcript_53224/m.150761 type:complete len:308 (+) Transcript_53224:1101-2024(+)